MKAFFPVFTWLVWVVLLGPEFRQTQWECLLVMFAAIELVPRGLQLLGLPQKEWYAALAAGFCAAYFFDGYWFLALPYLALSVWQTLNQAIKICLHKRGQLSDFVRLFALSYWVTGAAFAVLYLAGISPLHFDPVIVSLTAAHFHVAGFALSVLVYCLMRERPNKATRVLAWATLAGMPLVAAGIVASKLGFPTILEQLAALGFVLFAFGIIWQQVALGFATKHSNTARYLFLGGAGCLLIGVMLAGFYALRFQIPVEWVSIPNMKIWHGTLNALGFAWLSLLGYEVVIQKSV